MKKIAFFLMVAVLGTLYSCRKDRFEPNQPKNMEELQVPAGFDWKTTKDYALTITANNDGMVEVTNSNDVAYQRAFLTSGTPYTMKLTLPSFEKTVKLKFQGMTTNLALSGQNLNYQFN
ncbi:MAG TPA: hypothetical protein PKE03_00220 [Bacteroidales bacterium]|nr:hypothetical protein [Bacteroidales bacterium]